MHFPREFKWWNSDFKKELLNELNVNSSSDLCMVWTLHVKRWRHVCVGRLALSSAKSIEIPLNGGWIHRNHQESSHICHQCCETSWIFSGFRMLDANLETMHIGFDFCKPIGSLAWKHWWVLKLWQAPFSKTMASISHRLYAWNMEGIFLYTRFFFHPTTKQPETIL